MSELSQGLSSLKLWCCLSSEGREYDGWIGVVCGYIGLERKEGSWLRSTRPRTMGSRVVIVVEGAMAVREMVFICPVGKQGLIG